MNIPLTAIDEERDRQALAAAEAIAANVLLRNADGNDGQFSRDAFAALAESGLMGMAIPRTMGGLELSFSGQARVFAALAAGDLTPTFVLSQHQGCTTLVAVTPHAHLRERWLPALARGAAHGANGFNFLNLPLERAPMKARPVAGGYLFDGTLPWVTAAHHSDILAAGAVLPDGNQILAAIPLKADVTKDDGTISIDPAMELAALSGSDTTEVRCDGYFVADSDILLGPSPQVLKTTFRGATGYVPTAIITGHIKSSLVLIEDAAARRGGTAQQIAAWLRAELTAFETALYAALAQGDFESAPVLRGKANALSARAAHLALIVGGGTGYRVGHTAQRLYREAGFFSVWSASGTIIPETLTHLLTLP